MTLSAFGPTKHSQERADVDLVYDLVLEINTDQSLQDAHVGTRFHNCPKFANERPIVAEAVVTHVFLEGSTSSGTYST
jgi:hypothetical protein